MLLVLSTMLVAASALLPLPRRGPPSTTGLPEPAAGQPRRRARHGRFAPDLQTDVPTLNKLLGRPARLGVAPTSYRALLAQYWLATATSRPVSTSGRGIRAPARWPTAAC